MVVYSHKNTKNPVIVQILMDLTVSFLFTTGIALLYLQLHRVSNEASHLHRALDYVKRTMRILNGRKVTFLCGDAGPLAVGAVVHHKLNNTTDSKECLSRLEGLLEMLDLYLKE